MLVFVPYYIPGYKSGGPIQTVANMVDFMGDDINFYIITSDRDFDDKKPYSNVKVDKWNNVGKAKVFYASKNMMKIAMLSKIVDNISYDVMYLNSFFHPVFSLKPLLARRLGLLHRHPVVIAPRGEFSKGAYALKKKKKALFRWVFHKLGLYRNVIWQASSQFEVGDIQRVMNVALEKIFTAPNLVSIMNVSEVIELSYERRISPLKIIFLSRVSPKKNLDFALQVLHQVNVPIEFDVYGYREDLKYWKVCQKLIDTLPENININVMGAIEHSLVVNTMAKYDLFFLPTQGENFGHVIAEAMASGTPVLISDTTPWRGLEQKGVGWDLPLENKQKFVSAIESASHKDSTTYFKWRNRVREYFLENNKDNAVLNANRELFMRAINDNK